MICTFREVRDLAFDTFTLEGPIIGLAVSHDAYHPFHWDVDKEWPFCPHLTDMAIDVPRGK